MATKTTGFRFSEDTLAKLDALCEMTGQTRVFILTSLIASEYDKLNGNPELQQLLSQMRSMEMQLKSMVGGSDSRH